MKEGEALRLIEAKPEQHFTQPPPRFSEATLVKELEEKGIGRPSTYAAILSTIQERGYVEKKEARLYPTELGVMVNGLLVKSFPEIVSTDFTAQMEERLDEVEEGRQEWVRLLQDFYVPFEKDLEKAKIEMRDVKREETPTEHNCEKCGKNMVIKWGRNGHFLACSGYPECRNTKEYVRAADGSITVVATTRETDEKCPTCGSPMIIRRGRFGEFMACSKLPRLQDHRPDHHRRDVPQGGLRRVPHREALAPGQGVLRLRQLQQDQVRLRQLGPAGAPPLPAVPGPVRGREGVQVRRPPALSEGRLRLVGRQGRSRRRGRRRAPVRRPPDAKAS